MNTSQKTISVIIPVYNALDYVKKLLDSLLKNFDFNTGEIIIINDCSNNVTSAYLEGFAREHYNFKLLKNHDNSGFAKSCNRGLKEAKNDILVLLNSDTEIPQGFNRKIIDCFNSDSKIGIAFAIGSGNHKHQIPALKGHTIQQMQDLLDKRHKAEYPIVLDAEGFCFCIRKEVVKQQGYLDEVYNKGYFEETDFAMCAIKNGWKSVLIDNLYVGHIGNMSFGEKDKEKLMSKNRKIFQTRWETFMEKYIEDNFIINPVHKIRNKLLPYSLKRILNFMFIKEKAGRLRRIKIFGKIVLVYRKKIVKYIQ
jgi:GT2 family glycosyltransferase